MSIESVELIEQVLLRPRMFCQAQTPRELIRFLEGICCGRHPPHGSDCLPGIDVFVRARFPQAPRGPWPETLLSEFEDQSFFEFTATVLSLIREWEAAERSSPTIKDA